MVIDRTQTPRCDAWIIHALVTTQSMKTRKIQTQGKWITGVNIGHNKKAFAFICVHLRFLFPLSIIARA